MLRWNFLLTTLLVGLCVLYFAPGQAQLSHRDSATAPAAQATIAARNSIIMDYTNQMQP